MQQHLVQIALGSLAQQPLLLGAWFGLVHALDADHLSTIGALAVDNRAGSARAHAIRWASGHALALTGVGLLVLGLGLSRLTAWSRYAETLVALTLLVIGVHALATARFSFGGRAAVARSPRLPRHGASWLMGLLHGGAGSAAVLALIPLAAYGSVVESAVYLAAFSIGVAAGACGFAAVFAGCFARTIRAGRRIAGAFHGLVGLVAVAAGALLLWEVVRGPA